MAIQNKGFAMRWFHKSEEEKLKKKQEKLRTDFLTACQRGTAADVEKMLATGIDVNTTTGTGTSGLFYAVTNGNLEAVKTLLDHGANPNARVAGVNGSFSGMGTTPLLIAAQRNYTAIAELLLEHKANVQVSDSFGLTALHYAAKRNNFGLARELMGKDADATAKDKWGHTPEYYAQMNRNDLLADALRYKAARQKNKPPKYKI